MHHTIELELEPGREEALANFAKIRNLSPDQLLQDLVEQQLDVMQQDTGEIPQWHKDEIDRRLVDFEKNPDQGVPWSEARKRWLK